MMERALRLVRVYHDLNLSEASERVGLSKSYVSEMERGRKKVTLEVLQKYSSAFDLPVSSLMLFAEQAENDTFAEKTRVYAAGKALQMLDWIAMISSDKKSNHHAE